MTTSARYNTPGAVKLATALTPPKHKLIHLDELQDILQAECDHAESRIGRLAEALTALKCCFDVGVMLIADGWVKEDGSGSQPRLFSGNPGVVVNISVKGKPVFIESLLIRGFLEGWFEASEQSLYFVTIEYGGFDRVCFFRSNPIDLAKKELKTGVVATMMNA